MPFQSPVPRHKHVVNEKTLIAFTHADGSGALHEQHTKVTKLGQTGDIEAVDIDQKQELSCGCISPDVPVAGICTQCLAEQRIPHVCAAHYVVCGCGTSSCWKHSYPSASGDVRVCTRCRIRQENEKTKAAILHVLCGFVRRVFFRSQGSSLDDAQK